MEFMDILLVAMFIEAVVNALKPLWNKDGERLTVAEIVSMAIGVLIAIVCRINMLTFFVELETPEWVQYIFFALTGIALGRGPSFLYDLWTGIKNWQTNQIAYATLETGLSDVEISKWTLEQLKDFCALNDIDSKGCVTREDYMNAIERGGTAEDTNPPTEGGAE